MSVANVTFPADAVSVLSTCQIVAEATGLWAQPAAPVAYRRHELVQRSLSHCWQRPDENDADGIGVSRRGLRRRCCAPRRSRGWGAAWGGRRGGGCAGESRDVESRRPLHSAAAPSSSRSGAFLGVAGDHASGNDPSGMARLSAADALDVGNHGLHGAEHEHGLGPLVGGAAVRAPTLTPSCANAVPPDGRLRGCLALRRMLRALPADAAGML
mmetsp:Transcript_77125/g.223847  ORF Transcript_77125/g.223847 Transcript_77125/m.223847 type:complete len:213 (-) Transcript_77125:61-699(-)